MKRIMIAAMALTLAGPAAAWKTYTPTWGHTESTQNYDNAYDRYGSSTRTYVSPRTDPGRVGYEQARRENRDRPLSSGPGSTLNTFGSYRNW